MVQAAIVKFWMIINVIGIFVSNKIDLDIEIDARRASASSKNIQSVVDNHAYSAFSGRLK
jgi:hypothetical protein